jgi:hypothetical protein
MLGEVIGGNEREDMRLESICILVLVGLSRSVLDRSIHAFSLAVGPKGDKAL